MKKMFKLFPNFFEKFSANGKFLKNKDNGFNQYCSNAKLPVMPNNLNNAFMLKCAYKIQDFVVAKVNTKIELRDSAR